MSIFCSFEFWIDFVVSVTCKKFSNKANSHRGCHIGFNYAKGDWRQFKHTGNLNELPPCLFVVWSIVLVECELTCTGKVVMICKDFTKAGKKNAFTSGCKNFHFNFFLRGESQRFRDPPKMLGDPNLTGYVAPRTQIEKSQCHPSIANGFSLSIYWCHVISNLHKTDTSQWRIQTFR